jgi:hypothetical protein
MRTTNTNSSVQLSLFSGNENSVKDTRNGNNSVAKLSTYLKTRGGLFRLLALFPGNMPVEDALRQAPAVLTNTRKEVAV